MVESMTAETTSGQDRHRRDRELHPAVAELVRLLAQQAAAAQNAPTHVLTSASDEKSCDLRKVQ
jgi:hypothetical protein